MYYPFYYDSTYILVLIGAVLSMLASAHVQSTFNKYSKVRSRLGYAGKDVAQRMLQMNGINDVTVRHTPGNLSDNYNPMSHTVNLSDTVYDSVSVAALGVAAHECGHAMQHHNGYLPLSIRAAILPAANLGSKLGLPICIIGLFMGRMGTTVATIGLWLFAFAVLFQIVTLPVEFNASHRAVLWLEQAGILDDQELKAARAVLTAAALTYVAAAAASVLQLLRLFLIVSGGRRRD
ncbi:MAG: zinc metallopeptidase [Lachnospiraceae bacterium]|nr:zinc metallopeptidase [Lachnospiraceae bacterium]MCR5778639.1 zinc metallopeptidase [Lachnospiraceae bacterium]